MRTIVGAQLGKYFKKEVSLREWCSMQRQPSLPLSHLRFCSQPVLQIVPIFSSALLVEFVSTAADSVVNLSAAFSGLVDRRCPTRNCGGTLHGDVHSFRGHPR